MFFEHALNTFYFRLYAVEYMVKDNSDSERENLLTPLHGILFLINPEDLLHHEQMLFHGATSCS